MKVICGGCGHPMIVDSDIEDHLCRSCIAILMRTGQSFDIDPEAKK